MNFCPITADQNVFKPPFKGAVLSLLMFILQDKLPLLEAAMYDLRSVLEPVLPVFLDWSLHSAASVD